MIGTEPTARRVSELSRHQALNRVRRLKHEDRLTFLEYAAASDPDRTNALLDRFAGRKSFVRLRRRQI